MARYVDADKFAEEICNFPAIDEDSANAVISLLHRQPTADVVEVVRCEKCKHGEVSIFSRSVDGKERKACYCNVKNAVTDLNSYCPSGERRNT